MKTTTLLLIAITLLAITGCDRKPTIEAPQKTANMPDGQTPHGHPAIAPNSDPHAGMKAQEIPAGVGKKAKVTEVIASGGKTYMKVSNSDGEKIWLVMPKINVKAGDSIEYPFDGKPLANFTSKSLNRTFDRILFIPGIRIVK